MPHRPTERLPEVRAIMDLCVGHAELLYHQETPWASATFCGARHTIALRFAGIDATTYGEALICELPRRDIALAGKLVADLSVVSTERVFSPALEMTIVLNMLILEDG